MAYKTNTKPTTNLAQGNQMDLSAKHYVDLRIKQSQKGNTYLTGKLKGTELFFYVMKDDQGNNKLSFKDGYEGELKDIDKFTVKSGQYGDYEFAKNSDTGQAYFLSAREDAGQPVTNRNGEPVMKRDGSGQLTSADFLLKIMPPKEA